MHCHRRLAHRSPDHMDFAFGSNARTTSTPKSTSIGMSRRAGGGRDTY